MFQQLCRGMILAVVLGSAAGVAGAEDTGTGGGGMTAVEIVHQVEHHNQERTAELKQYKTLRHYAVEYKGFSATVAAKMDVEVNYDAATGKSLAIVSQSGSKFLCEKVLKRAVDSEKEAAQDKGSTALTEKNYRFELLGSETVNGRPAYMLMVEPRTESKFLYRGKIWVDAADFAVVKMETEPAKNPSFWISRTLIHFSSAGAEGWWLPQTMRSETRVRLGGTAVLTIDYGKYEIQKAVAQASKGNPQLALTGNSE